MYDVKKALSRRANWAMNSVWVTLALLNIQYIFDAYNIII